VESSESSRRVVSSFLFVSLVSAGDDKTVLYHHSSCGVVIEGLRLLGGTSAVGIATLRRRSLLGSLLCFVSLCESINHGRHRGTIGSATPMVM
jgi:hypothetical protein